MTGAIEIGFEVGRLQEFSRAFQDDVAAEISPRHVARRFGGTEAELLVVDAQSGIVLDTESAVPAAVHAIEFQEMRGRSRAALDFVHMHDVEAIAPARIAIGAANRTHRGT